MSAKINPFIDIQLSIKGDTLTIQYKIDPQFNGRTPHKIDLLAFTDETFNEPLYTIPGTDYYAVDNSNSRQNNLPSFLYKLRLTTYDNQVYYSGFVGWHPGDSLTRHKYLIAADISRREKVRYNYAGLFAYLLKRKSYLPNQDTDVDPVTGEPLVDNTATFGVGSAGGYYGPVLTRLSIEGRQTKTELSEDGRGSQYIELLSIRSSGFPFIDQHDIIVTPDNKRFTVSEANSKYFPGTTMILLQTPVLRLIPNTDTVYSIEVPDFPNEQ
jgi:hypothetical protein